MDPSYTALLAFNAITSHFARFSQQRTTTQEGDRQRFFQQRQFEAQREEQRQQAKERREQEWALATQQRETALEFQENQKVLDHWSLRLFPSQILQSHRCDGPTPLRVFLSLPTNGPRDLEGPVRQALQQFLYQTLEKIAYRPVVEDCARAAARQWRQARERLIGQGLAKDNLDADQRFGGVRAANLKRLEQEEALSAAGIALD